MRFFSVAATIEQRKCGIAIGRRNVSVSQNTVRWFFCWNCNETMQNDAYRAEKSRLAILFRKRVNSKFNNFDLKTKEKRRNGRDRERNMNGLQCWIRVCDVEWRQKYKGSAIIVLFFLLIKVMSITLFFFVYELALYARKHAPARAWWVIMSRCDLFQWKQ